MMSNQDDKQLPLFEINIEVNSSAVLPPSLDDTQETSFR